MRRRPSRPAAPRCSRYKGETLEEYWDYTDRILDWGNGTGPNMILDDGGDATLLVHLGARAEEDPSILNRKPGSVEEKILLAQIKKSIAGDPGRFTAWSRTSAA
jgi:adenosylhomocysteinase